MYQCRVIWRALARKPCSAAPVRCPKDAATNREIAMKSVIYATFVAAIGATAAGAEPLRWAGTTDPQTMDPHAVNSAPVLGFLNNVYEGLVRRGKDMAIEPALATSWKPIGYGDGWRFQLRQGVTFQDSSAFDASDVLFS